MSPMAVSVGHDPRALNETQQGLLRAALSSNTPQSSSQSLFDMTNSISNTNNLKSPDVLTTFDSDNADLSEYMEGDTSFLDEADLNGYDIDDLESSEIHDKRKILEAENGDAKRQEGGDKQAKKPGRKPLTTEPTTKRKAQNRAAQRAFRDRKEQHLKDLETKVTELTKTSDIASQENGLLKAQVQRLTSELKDYRRRLSSDSNRTRSPPVATTNHSALRNSFAFDFPAFGSLSNTATSNDAAIIKREHEVTPIEMSLKSPHSSTRQSPDLHGGSYRAQPTNPTYRNSLPASSAIQSFAGLFSPSILNGAATDSDYGFPKASATTQRQQKSDSGTDTNSGIQRVFRFNSDSGTSNTDSPSHSSMSQFNTTSSCDTSPGAGQDSPNKGTSTDSSLSTNAGGAKQQTFQPSSTLNGIDWLASQNGGQFDPVLFGDYREAQDAIVGDGEFNNGFFNEAYPYDFGTPLNFDMTSPKPTNNLSQQPQSHNLTAGPAQTSDQTDGKSPACQRLLAQVDNNVAGAGDDYGLQQSNTNSESNANDQGPMLSANTIWNKLQSNKDFQDGKFDLDSLCAELRQKAKCSESGVVVPGWEVDKSFASMTTKAPDAPSLNWETKAVDDAVQKLGGEKIQWSGHGQSQ